jgi:hypothetical protein
MTVSYFSRIFLITFKDIQLLLKKVDMPGPVIETPVATQKATGNK